MITIEIVIITYNSKLWIENCLNSIIKSDYDLDLLSVTLVDNNSEDNTISILESYKYKQLFGDYKIIINGSNQGFGTANNTAVKETHRPFILFLNVDTELDKYALKELSLAVLNSDSKVAMWEMRQFPYEHPKLYNPVTLETTWCSGAACLVKRDIFIECGMFDESIFMYAEDVDLCWRIKKSGFLLKYVPKSLVHHYSYINGQEIKPRQLQESIINNLRIRYKHGSLSSVIRGYILIFLYLVFGKNRRKLNRLYVVRRILALNSKNSGREKGLVNNPILFEPYFYKFEYEFMRKGAFYLNNSLSETPRVSIIVRTKNRPHLLKKALTSILNQTYSNIEVVVLEDGIDTSSDMIKKDFQMALDIKYSNTGKSMGRSCAANAALEISTGDFMCFLDDDDLLFADHIEVLVSELVNNKQYKIAYSLGLESRVSSDHNKNISYKTVFEQPFNRYLLHKYNFLPIQTVMFAREVYKQLGGMDESLDYLEDWDLWLRYSSKYQFKYIQKQTSIYHTPADLTIRYIRKKQLLSAEKQLHVKHQGYMESIGQEEREIGEKLFAKKKSIKTKLSKLFFT